MISFDVNVVINFVVKHDVEGLNKIKSELCGWVQGLSADIVKRNKAINALYELGFAEQQRMILLKDQQKDSKDLDEIRDLISKIDKAIKVLS